MNWTPLFGTFLFAILFPVLFANHQQNRSDVKWKQHENRRDQTAADSSLSGNANHSHEIQRFSSEHKASDERRQHVVPGSEETCEEARLKCAYRVGCGMALQVLRMNFLL